MTNKTRGFEWTSKHLERIAEAEQGAMLPQGFDKLQLPTRSTSKSAGYDFMSTDYVTVPSIWKQATKYFYNALFTGAEAEKAFKPTLVPTGVKAYMQDGEYLELANRSSNPLKRFLILANGVGVIDKDYYNNPDNDGHIMFQFINFGIKDQTICPGDKIGQGIFKQFLLADGDNATGSRDGGFGSTGS